MRDIGKTKSVSVYVDGIDGLSLLTCEFEDNGNINITCECEKITPLAGIELIIKNHINPIICLLYTSPSPRDRTRSRMPSSA